MRASLPERHPGLFRKDASVIRTPEWRRIHARLLQEVERLGLTLDEFAIGVGHSIGLLRVADRPISANTLYWLACAGADVNYILADERAQHPRNVEAA